MAAQWRAEGAFVIGTARSALRRADIQAAGARFVPFDLDAPDPFVHDRPRSVTLLFGPPRGDDQATEKLRRLVTTIGPDVPVTVVVSTAIFGATRSLLTERTHPKPLTERARRWAEWDKAALCLRLCGYDVAVVRTPAIYGPGRDHRAKLLTHAAKVIRPAAATSRIHVDDLARLLRRMADKGRPPILLATDELPAPTWRVVEEASRLLRTDPPLTLSPEEAKQAFSELGYEMRTNGHSCRSIVRPWLGVRLQYPTYREGLRASLSAGG